MDLQQIILTGTINNNPAVIDKGKTWLVVFDIVCYRRPYEREGAEVTQRFDIYHIFKYFPKGQQTSWLKKGLRVFIVGEPSVSQREVNLMAFASICVTANILHAADEYDKTKRRSPREVNEISNEEVIE